VSCDQHPCATGATERAKAKSRAALRSIGPLSKSRAALRSIGPLSKSRVTLRSIGPLVRVRDSLSELCMEIAERS